MEIITTDGYLQLPKLESKNQLLFKKTTLQDRIDYIRKSQINIQNLEAMSEEILKDAQDNLQNQPTHPFSFIELPQSLRRLGSKISIHSTIEDHPNQNKQGIYIPNKQLQNQYKFNHYNLQQNKSTRQSSISIRHSQTNQNQQTHQNIPLQSPLLNKQVSQNFQLTSFQKQNSQISNFRKSTLEPLVTLPNKQHDILNKPQILMTEGSKPADEINPKFKKLVIAKGCTNHLNIEEDAFIREHWNDQQKYEQFKGESLQFIFSNLADNLQSLLRFKGEKVCIKLVEKFVTYNRRLKKLIDIENTPLKEIHANLLLTRYFKTIYRQIIQPKDKTDPNHSFSEPTPRDERLPTPPQEVKNKKTKPTPFVHDKQFLDNIRDLNTRIETWIMNMEKTQIQIFEKQLLDLTEQVFGINSFSTISQFNLRIFFNLHSYIFQIKFTIISYL